MAGFSILKRLFFSAFHFETWVDTSGGMAPEPGVEISRQVGLPSVGQLYFWFIAGCCGASPVWSDVIGITGWLKR